MKCHGIRQNITNHLRVKQQYSHLNISEQNLNNTF